MGLIDTEAIILRTYNLAEADKIVVYLTRCGGIRRGVAHGARRLRSKFGAALEPFTLINLSYFEKEGRELATLKQTEIQRSYFELGRTVEVAVAMASLGELVLDFAPPHEPNENLFRLLGASLEALAKKPESSEAIKCYFEVWTLKLAGFMPTTHACTDCRRHFTEAEKTYLNAESSLRGECCSHGRGVSLSANARALLRAALTLHPREFAQRWIDYTVEARAEAVQLTRRLIERVLERSRRMGDEFMPQLNPVEMNHGRR